MKLHNKLELMISKIIIMITNIIIIINNHKILNLNMNNKMSFNQRIYYLRMIEDFMN